MREDLLDAVDPPAPERFEIVEQAMGAPQRRDVAAHALLPAVTGLGDEPPRSSAPTCLCTAAKLIG